jgi:hypothetical protein
MNIPINEEYDDLPTLYWISKLHKNPDREMYIAGYNKNNVIRSFFCKYNNLFFMKKRHTLVWLFILKYRLDEALTHNFSLLNA